MRAGVATLLMVGESRGAGSDPQIAVSSARGSHNRPRTIILSLAATLVIASITGCGGDESPQVAPTATTTDQARTGNTGTSGNPDIGLGDTSPPASASPEPANDLTLGDLIDRVNARWADTTAYREVTTTEHTGPASAGPASPAASPAAQLPTEITTIREVAASGDTRYVTQLGDAVDAEVIVIGDRIFLFGSMAVIVDPTAQANEWLETTKSEIERHPELSQPLSGLFEAAKGPLISVPDRLRPQDLRRLEPVTPDGRACQAFGAADTTETGARIDITLAIDADDGLCFIDTRSGEISARYMVEPLDESFAIEPPSDARALATPLASPTADGTPVVAATPISDAQD